MSHDFEIDHAQAVAVTLFAAALVERCQEMIVRLSGPETVIAEIAEFREAALQHVGVAAIDLPEVLGDDARQLARKHVEEICSDWLG